MRTRCLERPSISSRNSTGKPERSQTLCLPFTVEDRTELISTLDDDRLEHLDRAVAEGGKPLCYLGYSAPSAEDPLLRFYVRRLVEHAHDDWALGATAELAATLARNVIKSFGLKDAEDGAAR
jgi:hypothetical protein